MADHEITLPCCPTHGYRHDGLWFRTERTGATKLCVECRAPLVPTVYVPVPKEQTPEAEAVGGCLNCGNPQSRHGCLDVDAVCDEFVPEEGRANV